jgi:hypothetical protein
MWPVLVCSSFVGEHADEHYRAGDRQRDPEHDAARRTPAEHLNQHRPQHRRHHALRHSAGDRDPAHREQFLDVELQAHAKHQQDDADLGQLLGQVRIGDEPGRIGTHGHASEQISDDGGEAEALREVPEHQRGRKSTSQRQDQIERMHGS